jgi:hypothetical protein
MRLDIRRHAPPRTGAVLLTPETSVAYFNALTAPSKKLVWFGDSGHEPFIDEPDKFNAAMAELVRPVLSSDLPRMPRDEATAGESRSPNP